MDKMFCNQCQETKENKGCTVCGICGKNADVSNAQDFLILITKGLSEITTTLREEKKLVSKEVNDLINLNLFSTITNVNFDIEDINNKINKTLLIKNKLLNELSNKSNLSEISLCDNYILNKSKLDHFEKIENPDIKSLRQLITFGVKGISAYYRHANILLEYDDEIDKFIQKALADTINDNLTLDYLINLTLETGKVGIKAMELLHNANTNTYGNPTVTKVNIGVRNNPAILVSGHDLRDLEMLLEQTKNSNIDVYSHSEMLPAHYYPKLKKYKNFIGNYGGSWCNQKEEFDAFNGPILITTNCIVPPKESYKDRIYTTGPVNFPECKHISGDIDEKKDFSIIIEHAKKCNPPKEIESGEILGGFGYNQVLELSDKIIDAIKKGDIEKFVVMAGCDGRENNRIYYEEFAKALPKKTVIFTAGCAKYRYNKLNLGFIGEIPRVLDAGQCNDCYSIILVALKLKEIFELENINDLPIIYNISWYEQKAVIVLLSLLYLGVKNIHLGPTLPAFLSKNVLDLLIEKFNISGIETVEKDIKNFFEEI